MNLSPEERSRIVGAVEDLTADLIGLTRDLVNCKTDSQSEDNPLFAAEAIRCQEIVAGQLEAIGMDVEQWEEPPRYPVTAGVVRGRGGGRSIAINGHVDVVPVGDALSPWGSRRCGRCARPGWNLEETSGCT
jgi:acetylornithine deacetylase/succinyl-diaminopimelate desuccinylase-like protein